MGHPPLRNHQSLRLYQTEVLNGLLKGIHDSPGTTFTVMFPRQAGKNEVSAALVAALLRNAAGTGGSIVLCAPTFSPQVRISLERTRRALGRHAHLVEAIPIQNDAYRLRLGEAEAVFLSALPGAHVAGHTASIALIADEAQEFDGDWFERQFRPMTASTGAPTIMFGTAFDGESLLETHAAANRELDKIAPPDAAKRHWQVSWEEVAKARPVYGSYVRSERERLGPNHPTFLSQYELVAAPDIGRLLSPAQVLLLEAPHPRLWGPVSGERYVGGLDLGGEGEGADATVLTVARVDGRRCEVVTHFAWQAAPFATVEREVATIVRKWRLARLCVDATGLGAPLASALFALFGESIERVVFSGPVKSALGFALIAAAETNTIGLYEDDGSREARACRQQLRSCRARRPTPDSLIWGDDRGHDDYAVSLALCLRATQEAGPARIATGRRTH